MQIGSWDSLINDYFINESYPIFINKFHQISFSDIEIDDITMNFAYVFWIIIKDFKLFDLHDFCVWITLTSKKGLL